MGTAFSCRLSVPHNLGYLTQVTTYVAVFGEMAEGDRAVFAVAMLGDFARDLFVGWHVVRGMVNVERETRSVIASNSKCFYSN
jgi:hypothetical protein